MKELLHKLDEYFPEDRLKESALFINKGNASQFIDLFKEIIEEEDFLIQERQKETTKTGLNLDFKA